MLNYLRVARIIAEGEELDLSDPSRTCAEVLSDITEYVEDKEAVAVCGPLLMLVKARQQEYVYYGEGIVKRGREAEALAEKERASRAIVYIMV